MIYIAIDYTHLQALQVHKASRENS